MPRFAFFWNAHLHYRNRLRWPLLATKASRFGVPFHAASVVGLRASLVCCSRSIYSPQIHEILLATTQVIICEILINEPFDPVLTIAFTLLLSEKLRCVLLPASSRALFNTWWLLINMALKRLHHCSTCFCFWLLWLGSLFWFGSMSSLSCIVLLYFYILCASSDHLDPFCVSLVPIFSSAE